MKKIFTLLGCLFSLTAYSQREAENWLFGSNGGLSFSGNNPVTLTTRQLSSYEACASISDASGNLLFYTNAESIWDKNHVLMPGSSGLVGHTSATQGALIVRQPNNSTRYYVFTVDASDNQLAGGLHYSIVDVSLRSGAGGILLPLNTTVPTPSATGRLTEKLTAIQHANGRDTWVLVHEWQGNGFFAFLVTPTGIAGIPIVSRLGTIHQGGGGTFGNANSVGYMKSSPDGSLLGVATRDAGLELFNFNNATGQITNARQLYTGSTFDRTYGVAFSPDNTKLYTTNLATGIYQYNLSSATPASTRQNIGSSFGYLTSALQLGPDGRIYVALHQSPTIGIIANPNALGAACGYTNGSVAVGGQCQVGLPNFPNSFPQQVVTASIAVPAVCLGEASSFSVALSPITPTATHVWNFGEPSSGTANMGTGTTPTHTYAAAGTYTVTVTTTLPGGVSPVTTFQNVTVNQLPNISIGSPVQSICLGQTLVLTTDAQPAGSMFRWQDASTGNALIVTQPGVYTVTVTSPQGCSAQATTTVTLQPAPTVRLGADTTVCLSTPLVLRTNPQPAGAIYRWQDNSTTSTFTVPAAGTYAVEITLPGGCTGRDEIVVRDAPCPFVIPNIITPNGDTRNDAFVLEGLNAPDLSVEIYNRWGRQVYQKAAYDNSWNAAGQSAGVYYYILHNARTGQRYKGWVEVVR